MLSPRPFKNSFWVGSKRLVNRRTLCIAIVKCTYSHSQLVIEIGKVAEVEVCIKIIPIGVLKFNLDTAVFGDHSF